MRIVEAAIKFQGVVYTGRRHHNVIRTIVEKTGTKKVVGEQGFITDDYQFVDREEAAKIALAAGQIEKLKFHSKKLFSEDLY